MAKLDRARPFAQVYYDDLGRTYMQDDKYFLTDGTEWIDPAAAHAAPAAKPAHHAKAPKAAKPAPVDPVDEQLAAQLGGAA